MQKQPIQKTAIVKSSSDSEIPTRPFAAPKPASSEVQVRSSHNLLDKPLFPIQAKLTIGQPNDKYEQEADRVAHQVVNQIQKGSVQRQEISKDEELRLKPIVQRQSDTNCEATPELETSIQRLRGGGQSLSQQIREPMEQAFDADFSGVRVHADARADQLNRSIQAKAFTTGQDVFFRQGAYDPGSRDGQELIAHELTHVVQQTGGAVRRDTIGGGDASVELRSAIQARDGEQSLEPITVSGGEMRLSFISPSERVAPLMQQLNSAHRSANLLQRKLDNSLKGRDALNRLETALTTAGGFLKAPSRELYDKILNSDKVYTWEMIEQEFSDQFIQNLNGYVPTGSQQVVLYRADGRSPAKLKGSNPPGFGMRSSVPFGLLKAALLKNPNAFAEDHIRSNRQDLKSYSTDVGAGGFASNDRHLYEIDLGSWSVFERPVRHGMLASSKILANASNLANATKIAIDTVKSTNEIFLLFELGLTDITSVRVPGANTIDRIDWNKVVAEGRA
jgi:hypothetical protein